MDYILVDSGSPKKLSQHGEDLDSDSEPPELNLGPSVMGQKRFDAIKNRTPADLNHNEYNTREVNSKIRGKKRVRSESSDSTSSKDDVDNFKPRHNVKIPSVLVNPNRAIETAENEGKRRAILESQRNDKQVFDRNKRMFGMLMGTLKQFKTEETTREKSTVRRTKVEEKLELAVEEEKANLDRKSDQFYKERRQKHDIPDNHELRLDITERFKNWESTHRHLCSYIRTESKPKIFWLPKELDSVTEKRLKETKDYFSLCVAERTAKLKKDLEDLENETKLVTTKLSPSRKEVIDKESEYHSSTPDSDRR